MCSVQLKWAVACIFMFIVALILNYISTSGFINDTDQAELSDKYYLPISPPGITFSIWGIIYLWQTAWLIYITYHAVKYRQELQSKGLLTFSPAFYLSWIASCVFNGAWIITFAFESLTLSAIVLISCAIALYVNAYANHKYIGLAARAAVTAHEEADEASANANQFPSYILTKSSIAWYRFLLLNGIMFYTTWVSIAQCLNIAIFLAYVANVDVYAASCVALGILTAVILTYWFLDFYYLRSWLVYTYSPYAVLLWALSWVSTNPEDGDKLPLKGAARTWIYVLIAMVSVATACKIVSGMLWCCRPRQEQLNQTHVQNYSGVTTGPEV